MQWLCKYSVKKGTSVKDKMYTEKGKRERTKQKLQQLD